MSEKKQILIVEDEQDMAQLVAMRLEKEGYSTIVAQDGIEGLGRARKLKPDLILLDLMLPKLSGMDVAKTLREEEDTKNIPIIMLTAKREDSDVVVGLFAGADDYIVKPFSMSILLARISAVLRRFEQPAEDAPPAPDGTLTVGPITIDTLKHKVKVGGKKVTLTLTEFKILEAIMKARGRVLERNLLIDKAIGGDVIVTDRTIDVHINSLRKKLGAARKYIETVRGVGYCLAME